MAVTTVARAATGLAAIVLAAYALVAMLPAPREDERLALRVLQFLDEHRGSGAVMTLGDDVVTASCRKLPPWRSLVTLTDGSRLVLAGTRVGVPTPRGRSLESAQPVDGERRAAQADLAGSYGLYALELRSRLVHRRPMLAGTTRVGDTPTYVIRLGRDRPRVELLVHRTSLVPVAARYVSARLDGTSRLAAPVDGRGGRGC